MAALGLDVRMVEASEPAGRLAREALGLLMGGDREGAARLYREAAASPVAQRSSLVNLAALAIGLGNAGLARAHALRALEHDRADADAWLNFGVASWYAGQQRDGAQATWRALELAPGMEAAALNMALMLRATGQRQQGREVLAKALARTPAAVRLQQAMAEFCRQLGDAGAARQHALRVLALIEPGLAPRAGVAAPAAATDAGRVHAALAAACTRLREAGITHLLSGDLLLGLAREGEPPAGLSRIELLLDDGVERAAVDAAMAEGFRPVRFRGLGEAQDQQWRMGFAHEASGIVVDLLFVRAEGGTLRLGLGWPDQLQYAHPRAEAGTLAWRDAEWPVPAPLGAWLAGQYGADWRSFDARWFDRQLSSPGLLEDSMPRAVTLGLLRLAKALQAGQWARARALCQQLLAREELGEVKAVLARLEAAGIA